MCLRFVALPKKLSSVAHSLLLLSLLRLFIHKMKMKSKIENSRCLALTDMAVQNFVGDAFRGATWVALHNGGGVGW